MKVRSLPLSRATAEGLSADRPQSPKRWKPTIWTLEFDGVRMLVKDVSRGSRLFRYTLGRWNLRREARICARLDDLDFAPKCFGWLDRDAIVLYLYSGTVFASISMAPIWLLSAPRAVTARSSRLSY